MKKQPRDYQIAGADALWSHVHTKHGSNPLILMPTGSGKSLTMAMFVAGMVQTYPHLRFLSLTHVKELVAGNYRELMELWPTAPAGVYSAGLGRKDVHGQITFAGIDSIGRNIGRFGHIDFVVVDEAHRISDNEKSTYQKVFATLRQRNPNLVVIGFTATGFRMGTGMLTDGSLFDEICFDLSSAEAFVWMIQQRYLLRLVSKNPGIQVDESKVKIKAGEYDEKSASEAFREQDILERAVDVMIAHAEEEGRQAWLTFAQSIDDAELLADMFRYKGYPVEAVHSKRGDRDDVLAKHRRGELIGVVNKDVLTTGYDDPRIDLIGVLRLTRSPGLWCLHPDTEVLTPDGFVRMENLADTVMGYDYESGQASPQPITGVIKRPLYEGERLLEYRSRAHSFCVTDTHEMLYEQRVGGGRWEKRKDHLRELLTTSNKRLPTAAHTEDPTGLSLSLEACRLLGFWHADGSYDRSNDTIWFYQSERYPEVVSYVDGALKTFKYRRVVKPSAMKSDYQMVRWRLSKPAWKEIYERWMLDKERLRPLLVGMSRSQFLAWLDGYSMGDGSKQKSPSVYWTPATMDIGVGRRSAADAIQEACVLRGVHCRMVSTVGRNGRAFYKVYPSTSKDRMTFNPRFLHPVQADYVWCLSNPTGNLITRYRGAVTIMGNCQLLGRGTRPLWTPGYDISTWEGREASILASPKQNCRVLDFAGNILRLGPINYPTIPKQKKKKGGGTPPVRECPECGTHNHISLRCCEECGYEFPVQQKVKPDASSQELVVDLNSLPPPTPKEYGVFRVDQMIAAPHKGRNGKPDSMRVDYFCGVRRFSKWVCLQHGGYPRKDAERWWKLHAHTFAPATVEEGVARFGECDKPHYLKVWVNGKYPEIEGYDFEGLAFELPPELGGPPKALDRDTVKEAADRAEKDRVDALAKEMFDDDLPF